MRVCVPVAHKCVFVSTCNVVTRYFCASVGAYFVGRGFYAFYTKPIYDMGPNLTTSVLAKVINLITTRDGALPPILLLQMDNCAKENKNQVRLHV